MGFDMGHREKEKNFGLREEVDVNEVSVRSSFNPMPTGQRYGGKDLLLPFESKHYSHQSLVTRTITKMVSFRVDCYYGLGRQVSRALLLDGVEWLSC